MEFRAFPGNDEFQNRLKAKIAAKKGAKLV
jgi:hypothetical protein